MFSRFEDLRFGAAVPSFAARLRLAIWKSGVGGVSASLVLEAFISIVFGWWSLLGKWCWSARKKLVVDLITLLGQREVLCGDSAFIMRGELQRHFVKTNINIGMVIEFLRFLGDAINEGDAAQESVKLKGPDDELRSF